MHLMDCRIRSKEIKVRSSFRRRKPISKLLFITMINIIRKKV